jgi:hypothetical protein
LAERAHNYIHGEIPDYYTAARVSVRARSAHEAVEQGLDALDLLRGMWNFVINQRVWFRLHRGASKPFNQILLGPLHTLHEPGGKLAVDSFWYEPDYVGPVDPYDFSQNLRPLIDFEKSARRRLSRAVQ